MKKISTLFVTAVILFSACKKDDKPVAVNPEESGPAKEGLFTKASYYAKLSDSATLQAWHSDSIYYNAAYQISKIIDTDVGNESTVYTFSYN